MIPAGVISVICLVEVRLLGILRQTLTGWRRKEPFLHVGTARRALLAGRSSLMTGRYPHPFRPFCGRSSW